MKVMKVTKLSAVINDEATTVYFTKTPKSHLAKCAIQSFEESFRHFWKDSIKTEEISQLEELSPYISHLEKGSIIKFFKDGEVITRPTVIIKPEEVCFIPMISPKSSSDYEILKLYTREMADACWDMDPGFLSEIDDDNERLDYVNLQYITDKLPNNSPFDIWSHLCHGGTIYIDNKHNRVKLIKTINITK
ncbi:MAG TPA: hypothetical protein PLG47_03805 [Candidatus Dojkabacteria bacterium]|nr:hypothetical protein [Candidatus Dojkabacteria bacterium]